VSTPLPGASPQSPVLPRDVRGRPLRDLRLSVIEACNFRCPYCMPADRIGLIDSYFGQLGGWASTTPRWSGSGFTRLVVELADLPGHPARVIARRAKAKTEAWLAERLAHAKVKNARERSREIILLTEGAMALTLIHGGRNYIDAAASAARQLVRRR